MALLLSNLPRKVFMGAALGVIFGITFGDYNRIFAPLGAAYTMLLQAVVYPFLICSILSGLGKLSWQSDSKLLTQGIKIYSLFLIFIFISIYLLSQGLPSLSQSLTPSQSISANLINLVIPSNIFSALANNYVPAVVIFCIIFAVVLQKAPHKTKLINILDVISLTCIHFWNWLVKLAPFAVFFIIAETAGIIRVTQLVELSNYLVLFFTGTLLMAFWLLPVALSCLIDQPYSIIMKKLKPALIISMATTLSVAALPHIKDLTHQLLQERQAGDGHEKSIVNTTVSLSYPFGQVGNIFISLFMLFSSLYFNHPLSDYGKWVLPFISFISSLGSPSTVVNAVAFLSNWLGLPSDTVTLYFGIVPLVRYGQVLVSVMGIAFLTITMTYAFFNLIHINLKKLLIHLIFYVLVLLIVVSITQKLTQDPNIKIYKRLNSTQLDKNFTKNTKALIYLRENTSIPDSPLPDDTLARIQKTGILRVGYNADMRPFVFFNTQNELVGYDVDFVYALAQSLKAQLLFIPFTWDNLVNDVKRNRFDIAIGAIYVTPSRLQQVNYTDPYIQSPMSFIVPKNQKHNFTDRNKIAAISGLRIGVFKDPVLIPLVKANFPAAKLIVLPDYKSKTIEQAFAQHKIDTAIWSSAQTNVWALGHPNYVSVIPDRFVAPFLMAYMLNKNSDQFMRYLNYWFRLENVNNLQQRLYNRWIKVGLQQDDTPRWSILGVLLDMAK